MAISPNINETDRRILRELQSNARRSNKALAEAAGVSPSTALGHVRALEQRGIIRGYHAEVDDRALGRTVQAIVSVRLQPKNPEAVQRFIEQMWSLEETVAVTVVTGAYDVMVHVSVPDVEALADIVLRRVASAENVVDEQTSLVFDHRRKYITHPAH